MTDTVAYDRPRLYQVLEEVRGYFAELRYIDTAMRYLEGERPGTAQELLGGLVTPDNEYVEVELGRTFPFTKRYPVRGDWYDSPLGVFDDTRAERVQTRLAELAAEADEWAATESESMTDRIRPFTWPEGPAYESTCIEPIQDMRILLDDEVSNDFGLLQHTLSDWKGDAADNFASNFYLPFEHTLRSQKEMLLTLMGGITAARAIAESTQHSIMNVVHATRAALREQLQLAQATAELERDRSRQQTYIIAGGTATVFAGLLTGGSLWAAGLTALSGSIQIAASGIPEDGRIEFQVEGSTAEQLLIALSEVLGEIARNDSRQHEFLTEQVDDALRRVDNLRGGTDGDLGRLIPIRPDIVDGVDGETFYLP